MYRFIAVYCLQGFLPCFAIIVGPTGNIQVDQNRLIMDQSSHNIVLIKNSRTAWYHLNVNAIFEFLG